MIRFKKLLSNFLIVIMINSLVPVSVFAEDISVSDGSVTTESDDLNNSVTYDDIQKSGSCGNNLTWRLESDGMLTISGSGDMIDCSNWSAPWYSNRNNIKSVIINNGVTTIGNSAFHSCENLTNITIPNSVTTIGNNAFYGCGSLINITIPSSVTIIGESTFNYCNKLANINVNSENQNYKSIDGILFNKNETTLIKYPGRKTEASYTIPDSVSTIEHDAFYYCWALTNITMPNGVTFIGENAFNSCGNLTDIIIPDSVTTIEDNVFSYCNKLVNINVDSENQNYKSINGILFNKNETTLIKYPGGKTEDSYTIPDSVAAIEHDAFSYCRALTNITIPNSVTSIGESAFNSCGSLTDIIIPNSVTTIGTYAFSGCESLTGITIPGSVITMGDSIFFGCNNLANVTILNGVTTIGKIFFNCKNLKSITIPDSVMTIDENLFYGCGNLTSINVGNGNQNYKSVDGVLFNRAGTELIKYPEGKTETLYVIPDGVTTIGNDAFSSCKFLTDITIPGDIVEIKGYTFFKCRGLKSITIYNGMTTIRSYAFYECTSLTNITIPDSVTTIEDNAFYGCSGITSINVGDKNKNYKSADGILFNKAITELVYYPKGKTEASYVIPDSVITIRNYAFSDCSGLKSITIPYDLKTIKYNAFNGCNNLTDVIILSSDVSFQGGASIFKNCSQSLKLKGCEGSTTQSYAEKNGYTFEPFVGVIANGTCGKNLKWTIDSEGVLTISGSGKMDDYKPVYADSNSPWNNKKNKIKSAVINSGVTYIGTYAFCNCDNLTNIIISDTVTEIGENALRNTSIIASINVDSKNQSYMSIDGIMFNKEKTKLIYYPIAKTDKSYEIPNSVTTIGKEAFYYNKYLANVTIPNSVTTIENRAFSGCTGLTDIIIPNSVTTIGEEAFSSCTGLTDIIIPDSVTIIGTGAFFSCDNLTDVEISNKLKTIESNMFAYCRKLESITIPDSVTTIKYSAFRYCTSLKSITLSKGVNIDTLEVAFENCDKFVNVYVDEENKNYKSIDGILFNKQETELILYPQGRTETSYVIPDGVTSIRKYAFENCGNLKNVIIPDGVTFIGTSAFYNCSDLINISIPNSVKIIKEYAFGECNSLINIKIPNRLETIERYTFSKCGSLTSIVIPKSVSHIGSGVFSGCHKLNDLIVLGHISTIYEDMFINCSPSLVIKGDYGLEDYAEKHNYGFRAISCGGICGDNANWVIDVDGTLIISGIGAMADYENISDIPWNDYKSQIKSIEVNDGITSICNYAFAGCENLIEAMLPDSVKMIGESAFAGCVALREFNLPKSITEIKNNTFEGCVSIKRFNVPNNIRTIGNQAFYNCKNIKIVIVPKSVIEIAPEAFKECGDKLTMYGYSETCAKEYANNNNFKFISLTDNDNIDNIFHGNNESTIMWVSKSNLVYTITLGDALKGIIYVVAYDSNNKITEIKSIQTDGVGTEFSIRTYTNYQKAKVFFWDNPISMKPLADVESVGSVD